jgi:hypothetical protein
MDMKRLVIGTIVGGVAYYVVGYLIFGLAVADFYAANRPPGFFREETIIWAAAVGSVGLGMLLTLGIMSGGGAATIAGGLATGAVYNFLAWFGVDFLLYAGNEGRNLTLAVVDPLLEAIRGGIVGAVVAAVLSKVPKTATA